MNKIVYDCIDRIYKKKDYIFFREKCKYVPIYCNSLIKTAKVVCSKVSVYNAEDLPSTEFWFYFNKYEEGSLHVEYKSLLRISNIANLFVFQHEFSVKNNDPNRLDPVLDGFNEQGYTTFQYDLEEILSDFLIERGLKKLYLHEIDEVICDLKIPENGIFGTQVTVENLLFQDLYGICTD